MATVRQRLFSSGAYACTQRQIQTWVPLHAAFGQKFGNVFVSQGISQVPADAQDDHLTREMASFEPIGRERSASTSTLPDVHPEVRNGTPFRVRRTDGGHVSVQEPTVADLEIVGDFTNLRCASSCAKTPHPGRGTLRASRCNREAPTMRLRPKTAESGGISLC